MKSAITSIIVCLSTFYSFGQWTVDNLNYNNTHVALTNYGTVFNNPSVGPGYEIPKASGLTAIYSGMFWFMAKDATSQYYTSLGGSAVGGTDIDQGPYSTTNSYADPSYDEPFMISLCQSDIDNFDLWWYCANGQNPVGCENVTQPSVDVLNSIYNWPGNGDISLGQSQNLAPYFDRDGDGTYDPVGQGDYPIIKGCCATYMIQNDAGNPHTNSNTDPIGIEMHYLFYHYGANDLLYHTTFVDVMAINKGSLNYLEFTHSFFVDADLGHVTDDFIGSDSLNNMLYFYNADNNDENNYGPNPPALGVVALDGQLNSAVPFQPGLSITQMNGLMPSGSAWVDPNGNFTKFPYSGNPNSASEWNETSAGSQPNDRRGLLNNAHGQFNIGDTAKQSYAIIYSRIGNNLENAEHLSILASEAQTFFDSGADGCDAGGFASINGINADNITIYPNPSLGEFTVSLDDFQIQSLEIFNLTGKKVSYSKDDLGSEWKIDLSEKSSGIYLVHIETDHGQITKRIIVE